MGSNKHKNNKTQDNKKQQNQNQNANRKDHQVVSASNNNNPEQYHNLLKIRTQAVQPFLHLQQ